MTSENRSTESRDSGGNVNYTLPSGFCEYLPEEHRLELHLLGIMRRVFESYGFSPIETPAIERLEVLQAKDNQGDNIIYSVSPILPESQSDGERSSESRALKFDQTVPLAAYVARHLNELSFPFTRYQIDSVFRGERPKKYRYRQFKQCDLDVIGLGELSLMYDAQMVAVISDLFEQLGFGDFVIRINNRKLLSGFFEQLGVSDEQIRGCLKVVDELEKSRPEQTRAKLEQIGITSQTDPQTGVSLADQLLKFSSLKGPRTETEAELRDLAAQYPEAEALQTGLSELSELCEHTRTLGVPDHRVQIDLSVARGLGYYTGSVFETTLLGHPEIGSICSGGRYDHLVGIFCKKQLPGVGISVGWSRLFTILLDQKVLHPLSISPAQVMILNLDQGLMPCYLKLATELRQAGLAVCNSFEQRQVGKQIKRAERLGIPVCVLVGPGEAQSGTAKIKFLASREQIEVAQEEIGATIKEQLGS